MTDAQQSDIDHAIATVMSSWFASADKVEHPWCLWCGERTTDPLVGHDPRCPLPAVFLLAARHSNLMRAIDDLSSLVGCAEAGLCAHGDEAVSRDVIASWFSSIRESISAVYSTVEPKKQGDSNGPR